jgi:peptide/nickel transport system substrate-binding protein
MALTQRSRTIFKFLLLANITLAIITGTASAKTIDRLTVGTTMQVKAINIDDYYFGIMRAMLTHKGLVRLDEQGQFAGDLAASWETSDAITWTFHLTPGLTWHDGQHVRAEDVKFTIDYLLAKVPVYQHHFKLIDTVMAPDENTVVIRLSEPNPRVLVNLLVLRTLPKHIFEKVEDPRAFQGPEAAMGCGPYVFDGFDPAAGTVRFKAYEAYHRGRPNVSEVVFRLFKNPDTLYMAFKKGEVDLPYFYAAGADPVHTAPLEGRKEIVIHEISNLGVPNVLFFNTAKPPLDQLELRRALALAIDYEEMVQLFAGGYGAVPSSGFVPRGSADYIDTPVMAHDPEQARKILADLGCRDKDQDGILENKGQPLSIEVIVRTDTAANLRIAGLLKKRFAKIGVDLSIKPVDTTLFRQISDKERSHQLLLSRTTPWGMMMWAGLGTGYFDARNIGWANLLDPSFARIVDRMNAAVSPGAYASGAADLQRFYADQLPGIALYWNVLLQPAKRSLSGFKVSPMYGFLWEETWFSLKTEAP